jgi:RHS repeat-associated protein
VTTQAYDTFNGQTVAVHAGSAVMYLHGDHLGSVRLLTIAGAGGPIIAGQQGFRPWGSPDPGLPDPPATTCNYTGQQRDATGLLYYHARFYDPVLGWFISPDPVIPSSASGTMEEVALRPLTVNFSTPDFIARLTYENQQRPWVQLDADEQRAAPSPWGPSNPQALNRYSYVQNNPMRWTDPTGYCPACIVDWEEVERRAEELWDSIQHSWDAFWADVAQYAYHNGAIIRYKGADQIERTIQSRVKENLALRKEATRIGQTESTEANRLLKQFLEGNPSPGIGTKRLPNSDVFYLRGKDGARVFVRQVSSNNYEILAYADKNNERRVIELLYEYYVK